MNYFSIVYLIIIAGLVLWISLLRTRVRDMEQEEEKNRRERKTMFMFLNSLGDRLTTEHLALEPALNVITEFIVEVTEAESGAAFVLDEAEGVLSAQAVNGTFPPLVPTPSHLLTKQKHISDRLKRERIALGEGIIGTVAATGEPMLVMDAENDSRVPQTGVDFLKIRSIMAAPLKARGKVLGVLAVVNKRGIGKFTNEELDLLLSLSDQAASTVEMVKLYAEQAEKQRIEQELRVAQEFQRMLLPSSCPQPAGFEIAAFSSPALEVGGDYYDLFWVDDDLRYLGIVIADVSGKGIPGALIMSVVRCTMRATAQGNLSPRDVMIKANDRVYRDTKENVFVTMTYGILDTKERTFRFARAGHEPTVTMKRNSSSVQLSSPDGIALGLISGELFDMLEETVLHLEKGDVAVLYTDGVVEAMDEHDQEYGQRRFFDFLSANRELHPFEIIENTISDIKEFTRGHPQHDDITLVAVRVLGEQAVADSTPQQVQSVGT